MHWADHNGGEGCTRGRGKCPFPHRKDVNIKCPKGATRFSDGTIQLPAKKNEDEEGKAVLVIPLAEDIDGDSTD